MIDTSCNNPHTKKAEEAIESPEELLRLWKEKGNLVAGLFLAHKHHFRDEELLYAFRQAYPSLNVEMEKQMKSKT